MYGKGAHSEGESFPCSLEAPQPWDTTVCKDTLQAFTALTGGCAVAFQDSHCIVFSS